jgi:alpha-ketoglutarate-dependent 2,4-dichlorophenoxyacetate dioxygenase
MYRTEQGLIIKPFRNDFGAEIEGVDFSQPIPQAIVNEVSTISMGGSLLPSLTVAAQLLEVQDRYAVTIYRKTALDNDKHVAFASQLGSALEQNPFFANSTRLGTPFLFDVSKYVHQARSPSCIANAVS